MGKFNYFSYKYKRLNTLTKEEQEDLIFDLINAFAQANTPTYSALLLQDLLTENEVANLAKRLRIAKLLLAGSTYREVIQEVHVSHATVAKVNMWLDNAGEGLKHVISKLPNRRSVHKAKWQPGIGYGLDQILLHYASLHLKKGETKRLSKFLETLRVKSADDKDFREEINLRYANKKIKKA